VHPLEGIRPFIYEEEAAALYVALEALERFLQQTKRQLDRDDSFPTITKRLRINISELGETNKTLSVQVSTLPDVSQELWEMAENAADEDDEDFDFEWDDEDDEDDEDDFVLRDDLVPDKSFLSLGLLPWDNIALIGQSSDFYQNKNLERLGDGLPVILIQTTAPKAKIMIEKIKEYGGLQGIGFNPGFNPFSQGNYDLGVLKTEDENLFLFGEFDQEDTTHINARKQWDLRCKKTKGYCALIVAKGVSGNSKGNPQLKDMMALFECRSLSAEDLDLGVLELM
ncbi:MAG TPA: hypothetical protein V6C58_11660, partial [Allocoleopsis sp.]